MALYFFQRWRSQKKCSYFLRLMLDIWGLFPNADWLMEELGLHRTWWSRKRWMSVFSFKADLIIRAIFPVETASKTDFKQQQQQQQTSSNTWAGARESENVEYSYVFASDLFICYMSERMLCNKVKQERGTCGAKRRMKHNLHQWWEQMERAGFFFYVHDGLFINILV